MFGSGILSWVLEWYSRDCQVRQSQPGSSLLEYRVIFWENLEKQKITPAVSYAVAEPSFLCDIHVLGCFIFPVK